MPNPKIEFGIFTLNHSTEKRKTFRDFAEEVLSVSRSESNEKAFQALNAHFFQGIQGQPRTFGKSKLAIALYGSKINKYHHLKPKLNASKQIIHGVINGGRYGSEGLIANRKNNSNVTDFNKDGVICYYHYLYLYMPTDYHSGFFMVSCNSHNESIKKALQVHLNDLFSQGDYKSPDITGYCPSFFRNEFSKDAIVQSMTFQENFTQAIKTQDDVSVRDMEFTVKIQVIPKEKTLKMGGQDVTKVFNKIALSEWSASGKKRKALQHFKEQTAMVRAAPGTSPKKIEWDHRDADHQPVVYLKNRVDLNSDNTIDFKALEPYIQDLFDNDILNDIRPDLNAKKI